MLPTEEKLKEVVLYWCSLNQNIVERKIKPVVIKTTFGGNIFGWGYANIRPTMIYLGVL